MDAFLRSLAARTGAKVTSSDLDTILAYSRVPTMVSEFFREANFVTTPAASGVLTTVVQKQVPSGCLGILEGFANGVGNNQDWDSLTFQVTVNDVPIPGYDSIQGPMGWLPVGDPMWIPLFHLQTVKVLVTSTAGAVIQFVTAALFGRFFPAVLPPSLALPRAPEISILG